MFESLRFENGGGLPINIGGLLTFYVCDDDGTIVFLPADGEPCVFAGIDSLVFALAQAPANVRGLATGALLGAGYGSYNASGMSFLFSGYVAARSVGLFDGLKAFSFGLSLQNPPLAGSPMLAGFGGALGQFGLGNINGLIDHTTGTEQAVRCDAGAYFSIDNCEINCGGANGDGMRTYTGGTIRTGNNTGTCTRYGAYALQGGAIYIDTDDAGPQGGVANLAVGVTPDTAAAIAVVGNALLSVAQNDGSVIQRVG